MKKGQFSRIIAVSIFIYLLALLFGALCYNYVALVERHNYDSFADAYSYEYRKYAISVSVIEAIVNVIVFFRYLYFRATNSIDERRTEDYVREVKTTIPPAIASLLLDKHVEDGKDYVATVAYLALKEYIKIENEVEVYEVKKDINDLSEHEKYVYECVLKKDMFDSKKFMNLVQNDAYKLGLIKMPNILNIVFLELTIALFVFICMIAARMYSYIIIPKVGFQLPLAEIILVFYIIYLMIKVGRKHFYGAYRKLIRTKTGDEEAERFAGLKLFLQEYTYMTDQTMEGMEIYDSYIPYAIALGEGEVIEEDEYLYRNLIYRGEIN